MSESDEDFELEEVEEVEEVENQAEGKPEEKESEDKGAEEGEKPKSEEKKEEDDLYLDFNQENLPTDKVKRRIAAETRQRSEDKRKIAELERKLLAEQKRIYESSKPGEVKMPSPDLAVEDPEEYHRQIQAYYESQNASKEWEQKSSTFKEKEAEIQRRENEALERQFLENAARDGITPEQADASAKQIAAYAGSLNLDEKGIERYQSVMRHVLTSENGGKLLNHLSSKPEQLSDLMRLNDYEVGYKLAQMTINISAQRTTNAPPPDEPLKGGSVPQEEDDGATYE